MSEDVKPRIWKIKKLFNRIADSNSFEVFQIAEGLLIKEKDTVKVIELEPTMRMMDELAEVLRFIRAESRRRAKEEEVDAFYYGSFYDVANKALEKYRKFKEGLK